jgi:hypothetical protein
MSEVGDNEKYKVKILNLCLHVPVAQMSQIVFNEINSVLSKKEEPNEIAIHFRRIEIRYNLWQLFLSIVFARPLFYNIRRFVVRFQPKLLPLYEL